VDDRRCLDESLRLCNSTFALIKYVPLTVKSWRFHLFRAGSTEEVAPEAGHLYARVVAHFAHDRRTIQTAILSYVRRYSENVLSSESDIFTLAHFQISNIPPYTTNDQSHLSRHQRTSMVTSQL
jgi:hypothetical protein